jgi:hypothetical protein
MSILAMVVLFLKEKYCLLMLLAFYVLLCLAHAYSFVGGGSGQISGLPLTEVTLLAFLTV